MALPSGWVARRFGYRAGILTGLIVVIAGCLLFIPVAGLQASHAVIFAAFLGALFVLGSGLTFLETIANPYATVLGPAESGVARINLGQSCNAVGWIIGPILASSFVLSKTSVANTSNAALVMPYLIVASMVAVMHAVGVKKCTAAMRSSKHWSPCPRRHASANHSLTNARSSGDDWAKISSAAWRRSATAHQSDPKSASDIGSGSDSTLTSPSDTRKRTPRRYSMPTAVGAIEDINMSGRQHRAWTSRGTCSGSVHALHTRSNA